MQYVYVLNRHGEPMMPFPSFVCTTAAQGMAPRRLLCGHSVHMRCSWRRYRLTIQPPYNYLII